MKVGSIRLKQTLIARCFSLLWAVYVSLCVSVCLRVISQSWHILRVITFSSILFFWSFFSATVRLPAYTVHFFFTPVARVLLLLLSSLCYDIEGWMVGFVHIPLNHGCLCIACLLASWFAVVHKTHIQSHNCDDREEREREREIKNSRHTQRGAQKRCKSQIMSHILRIWWHSTRCE